MTAALRAHVVVPREHFTVDVALQVAAGETVAIMGPSGAGKSTVMQALAGVVGMAEGEIEIGGRAVDRVAGPRVRTESARRGIVLLGQNPRLFPHLSVRENVAFGPRAAGVAAGMARSDADEWLARVGLPGSGGRMPHELSGGEGQRVAVARALAAAPSAVLLDEPLVALDPDTAGEIRRMLREQLDGTTTVAVTHDAGDAVALADRLVVLEAGRITQQGAVREVLAAPASRFVASIAGVNRVEGVSAVGGWRRGDVRLLSADAGSQALAAEDGVALAAVFRPGDAEVAAGGAPNSWTAVVTGVEPTVSGVRVLTDLGAVDLSLTDAVGLRPGDALTVRVAPEHVRFVAAS